MERSDLHEYQNYCVDFPESMGTSDCVIVAEDEIGIVDFKYGLYRVPATSLQLRIYALGACEVFADVCDDRECKAKRSGSEGTGRCVRDQPREREMAGYLP